MVAPRWCYTCSVRARFTLSQRRGESYTTTAVHHTALVPSEAESALLVLKLCMRKVGRELFSQMVSPRESTWAELKTEIQVSRRSPVEASTALASTRLLHARAAAVSDAESPELAVSLDALAKSIWALCCSCASHQHLHCTCASGAWLVLKLCRNELAGHHHDGRHFHGRAVRPHGNARGHFWHLFLCSATHSCGLIGHPVKSDRVHGHTACWTAVLRWHWSCDSSASIFREVAWTRPASQASCASVDECLV